MKKIDFLRLGTGIALSVAGVIGVALTRAAAIAENASSGSIVMEDLTDAYANGNYVIGYWNRGEVAFNPYVSLVLYDVEGDDNELVLTGIDFNYLTVAKDGVCGLSFSQSAVDAAAEAAISAAGYTGSYAVRISFVPTTGDNTLDYAITFDTVNA